MFSDDHGEGLIMLIISMTVLTVVFVFFLITSLVRLKNKQIKREEELLKALIEERERTMSSVSSEIHDNVNQLLSLAKMSLSMMRKTVLPEQGKYLDQCNGILETVIGDLRNISHSLNSAYLKRKGFIYMNFKFTKKMNTLKNKRLHTIAIQYPNFAGL